MKKWIVSGAMMVLTSSFANAVCEENVDEIDTFYINGMFTDVASFYSNKQALESFISNYLAASGFNTIVSGSHNFSEPAFDQIMEVARQKFEDASSEVTQAFFQFMNGDNAYLNDPALVTELQSYIEAINTAYEGTLSEADTIQAKNGVIDLLNQCGRVILITHSQGNFYGNVILNDIYSTYSFPNGYPIAEYPMLGIMQIASPTFTPGGATGTIFPEIVGHLTNDNDLVMAMVRQVIGSVLANFSADYNEADFTGHGLELAYLSSPGQASNIADQMRTISTSLTPYPMQGQIAASSSALSGFGYSSINSLLDIEFNTGGVYRYSGVGPSVFSGLQGASSQGTYFNANIRDNFDYTQIE